MKTLFDSMVKNEKIHYVLGFNQSQMLKPYVEFKKQKRIQARKNGEKDEKAYKSTSNAVCGKTMKTVRNRIDEKLLSNKKRLLINLINPSK